MEKNRISLCLLFTIAMVLVASIAQAELKIDSVYPNTGKMGEALEVTVRGEGFDQNTRLSFALDSTNQNKEISALPTPGYAIGVAIVQDIAYIADSAGGLQIADISSPDSPVIINSIQTQERARSVAVRNNIAYVSTGYGGLQVINVSDPFNLKLLSSVDGLGWTYSISIVGDILYLTNSSGSGGFNGLQIIDIENPNLPIVLAQIETPGKPEWVDVADGKAYVADGSSGLQIIDVSNPSSPDIIGEFDTPGHAESVKVIGDNAYVADNGSNKLHIINVKTPSAPQLIRSVDTPDSAEGVTVANNIAYVTCRDAGLFMADVSNSSNPVIIGSVATADYAMQVIVIGGTAYVTDGNGGLRIIDVSNPAMPNAVGSLYTGGSVQEIELAGNIAFLGDMESGLKIADVSSPSSPALLASLDLNGSVQGMDAVDDIVYLAYVENGTGKGGIAVIDVGNPSDPSLVGSFETTTGWPYDVAVRGNIAYATDYYGGIRIIDISSPSEPKQLGSAYTSGWAHDIFVNGDIAYVTNVNLSDSWQGVHSINISNPSNPIVLDSIGSFEFPTGITAVGNVAYVADRRGGLQLIDAENPYDLKIIGSMDTPGFAYGVTVIEDVAYVADYGNGIQVISVNESSEPIRIGSVDTPGLAFEVEIKDGLAYVADGNQLFIAPLPVELDSISVIDENTLTAVIPSPPIPGNYTLHAFNASESDELPGAVTFMSSDDYTAQHQKKAIIVAGSGSNESNTLWEATHTCANYAFYALMSQGYGKENIQYLSPEPVDVDGDGISDVDDDATYDTLRFSLAEWAGDADELLLYMSGHGGIGHFLINGNSSSEYLAAEELDSWLDTLQTSATRRAIVIYDSCRSGSFLPFLNAPEGKERIVITSAMQDEYACFLNKGTLSFSYQFWASVILNADLYKSFSLAKTIMQNDQTGIIDADGNGVGNEKNDLSLSQNILIGRGRIVASLPPSIAGVSEKQILDTGSSSAVIRAYGVDGLNAVTRVWAVIVSPDQASASPESPITQLPQIELAKLDNKGNYLGEYDEFCKNGTYSVNIFAEDSDGLISVPLQTFVTQTAVPSDPHDDLGAYGHLVSNNLRLRAVIHTEEKGDIEGQWQLGGQDTTARGDQVFWGYFYASPDDVTWGSENNPDLFVKIWIDVTGPIYVNYFHVSVPDITVYTDFDAGSPPAADQTHTATLTTRFVEHSFINGQSDFTLQNEDGVKPPGYSETAAPYGCKLTNNLRIGSMINTVEKGPIEGIWSLGGQDTTARGDTVIWGHFYADPNEVPWGSPQNPDLFVKIWFDVGGTVNVDFFHVSVPDIEVYSELPADGTYDNSGTTVLGNRFIEHRYMWK